MRKLIYFVACSVDGYICHEDGSIGGFLTEGDHLAALGALYPETRNDYRGANKVFDTVLMGRKTYAFGFRFGVTNPYASLKQLVFSHSMKESPDENVELISEDAVQVVRSLKQKAGKAIWLCGGGMFATTLFAAGLVDELILKVNPFLMGSGIPFFSGDVAQTALRLTDSKVYNSGVAVLHYQINP